MRVESAQCVVCSTLPVLKFKAGITNIHRTGKISPWYDSVFRLVLSPFSGTVKYNILRASGGFAPCTPTRLLPWSSWGTYSTPRPPAVLSNDLWWLHNDVRSLYTLKDTRAFWAVLGHWSSTIVNMGFQPQSKTQPEPSFWGGPLPPPLLYP